MHEMVDVSVAPESTEQPPSAASGDSTDVSDTPPTEASSSPETAAGTASTLMSSTTDLITSTSATGRQNIVIYIYADT